MWREERVLYLRHRGDEVRGSEYLLRFVLLSEAESVASAISDLGIPIILCGTFVRDFKVILGFWNGRL